MLGSLDHHAREHENFLKMMHDLDAGPAAASAFFSANLGSLSDVLSSVSTVTITERSRAKSVEQVLEYR